MINGNGLPRRYFELSNDEMGGVIAACKARLGDKVVILGHHYQRDDVIEFADFRGDSFRLSQLAAERVGKAGAKYVVFCGVHFMAEAADILTPSDVAVVLPELGAGCPMADMADAGDVERAWGAIHEVLEEEGYEGKVVPVTYINSTAAIKGFVGKHGGAVCTSSNARQILEWAFGGGDDGKNKERAGDVKVMFFPDQHLGRNTAAAMGYDVEKEMCLWDARDKGGRGGVSDEDILRSKVILWKGYCWVHTAFGVADVERVRRENKGIKVIVHPECEYDVVQMADMSGSTGGIVKAIEEAEVGSKWAIGTEMKLVNRLAIEAKKRGVEVMNLVEGGSECVMMSRIDRAHLLWVLERLVEGEVVNQIKVSDDVRGGAKMALRRMLDIAG